jgi:hypothetical protein
MNSTRYRFSIATTVWTILVLAAILLSGRSARATFLDDWPIKFHPHFDLESTYDDNILITPTNRIGDFSFTVSPGLQLVYGNADHNYLSLDYTAGIERFYRRTEFDAVNHYVTFNSIFNFSRLRLQVDHIFKDETSENFEAATRLEEQSNLTSINAEYSLNQYFSVGALYHQEFHHFPTPGQIDNELFEPGVAVYYHLTPKTDIFGEFDYGWADVSQGDNQQFESASLGVRGKITSKIKGQVAVGYENRDFSGPDPASSIATVVATGSLHGDFTRHTSADLVISRQISPSITNTASSVTTTRADFTLNEKIYHEKFLVYAGGAYEHDDYGQSFSIGPNRVDDIVEGRVGVKYYATKWMEFGVSYRYQYDRSTVAAITFDQNLASIDALVHF